MMFWPMFLPFPDFSRDLCRHVIQVHWKNRTFTCSISVLLETLELSLKRAIRNYENSNVLFLEFVVHCGEEEMAGAIRYLSIMWI